MYFAERQIKFSLADVYHSINQSIIINVPHAYTYTRTGSPMRHTSYINQTEKSDQHDTYVIIHIKQELVALAVASISCLKC